MSGSAVTDEIQRVAPEEARFYSLVLMSKSARLPAKENEFFQTNPTAWPTGITDGEWMVFYYDAQKLLLHNRNIGSVILKVHLPKSLDAETPVSQPQKAEPHPLDDLDRRRREVVVWDMENRTAQNIELRDDLTNALRDVYRATREYVTESKQLQTNAIENLRALEGYAQESLTKERAHLQDSTKKEREAIHSIWKEIDELRSQAKPDYAAMVSSVTGSLATAATSIWLGYLEGKKKGNGKGGEDALRLLVELADPTERAKLLTADGAKDFAARAEKVIKGDVIDVADASAESGKPKVDLSEGPPITLKAVIAPGPAAPSTPSFSPAADSAPVRVRFVSGRRSWRRGEKRQHSPAPTAVPAPPIVEAPAAPMPLIAIPAPVSPVLAAQAPVIVPSIPASALPIVEAPAAPMPPIAIPAPVSPAVEAQAPANTLSIPAPAPPIVEAPATPMLPLAPPAPVSPAVEAQAPASAPRIPTPALPILEAPSMPMAQLAPSAPSLPVLAAQAPKARPIPAPPKLAASVPVKEIVKQRPSGEQVDLFAPPAAQAPANAPRIPGNAPPIVEAPAVLMPPIGEPTPAVPPLAAQLPEPQPIQAPPRTAKSPVTQRRGEGAPRVGIARRLLEWIIRLEGKPKEHGNEE